MPRGYRNIANNIAFQMIPRRPIIPDFTLMVGCAENLHSLPLVLYNRVTPPEVQPLIDNPKNMTHEQMADKLTGFTYSIEDFPTDGVYMGLPSAGV